MSWWMEFRRVIFRSAESRSTFVDETYSTAVEKPILNPLVTSEIDRFIQLQNLADKFLRESIPIPRYLLLYRPQGCIIRSICVVRWWFSVGVETLTE